MGLVTNFLSSWLFSQRRTRAELRGIRKATERLADAFELQQGKEQSGASFRSFYSDKRGGATDEATFYAPGDEDYARFEREEQDRASRGTEVEPIEGFYADEDEDGNG